MFNRLFSKPAWRVGLALALLTLLAIAFARLRRS